MPPPERTRLRISPLAPLLLALFVWLSSPALLGALLLAALCHELGHYAALRRLGGWVRELRISVWGAEMRLGGRLSYGGELLAAAAGPAVNLLLGAAFSAAGGRHELLYLLAGAQLVLGLFNLLPILPLDGGRILWLGISWATDPFLADGWLRVIGTALSLALLLGALLLQRQGGSPFLLLGAAGLALHSLLGYETGQMGA